MLAAAAHSREDRGHGIVSVRSKTLLITTITIGGLIAILYLSARLIVLGSFSRLERESMGANVARARQAILQEVKQVDTTCADWAPWDDTYAFVQHGGQQYITANLADSSIANLQLNLIAVVNSSGKVVYISGFDLGRKAKTDPPKGILPYLAPGSVLLSHASTKSSHVGIVQLPEGLMLVSARPILTSDWRGPIRGTLVFGRLLDLERIAEITRLSVSTQALGQGELPPHARQAVDAVTSGSAAFWCHPNGVTVSGYATLPDLFGRPAFLLEVKLPRAIYREGRATLRYLLISLVALGSISLLVVYLLMEKAVLRRLARLSAGLGEISDGKRPGARVSLPGKDELSAVADAVNGMLASREKAESAIRESETKYREMADALPGVVFEIAESGRITYANRSAFRILGYSQEMLDRGLSASDVIAPEDVERAQAKLRDLLRGGGSDSGEYLLRRADGSSFPAIVHTAVIVRDGKAVGLRGHAVDITDRKRIEERISRTNACLLQFGPDPDENISRLTALAGEMLGATCALYNRLEEGKLCALGQWHTPPDFQAVDAPDGHICHHVILQGGDRPTVIRRLDSSVYAESDPNVRRYALKTYVGHPVKRGEETIGSLCVVYQKDRSPSDGDLLFLGIIASAVGVEEERKRGSAEIAAWRYRYETAVAASGQVAYEWDPRTGAIVWGDSLEQVLGYSPDELAGGLDQLLEMVHPEDRGQAAAIRKQAEDTKAPFGLEFRIRHKLGHYLWVQERGVRVGADENHRTHVLGLLQDITQRKRAEEAIRHQAHYDGLTELPNRVLLYDRMSQLISAARRRQQVFAVLCLDLDGFKLVNDAMGHPVGDEVLAEVARRLRGAVRGEDTVARLGGDEFVVVLPSATTATAAGITCQRILEVLREPIGAEGQQIHVGCSIGVSLYPADGEDIQSLLRSADHALYRAKDEGKGTFRFYALRADQPALALAPAADRSC